MKYLSGSERRLLAFAAALLTIALSGLLKLDGNALTAITAVTLGYLGQGVAKEWRAAKK